MASLILMGDPRVAKVPVEDCGCGDRHTTASLVPTNLICSAESADPWN
jgi:hypothetical protein